MPDSASIVQRRRVRRASARRAAQNRVRFGGMGCGIALSLLLGVLILLAALTYADLTRDLPSITILPHLLNPPDGLLLQPTRVYDRTGQHLLLTFAPTEFPRRYLPLNPQNPQHLPESLADATIAMADPGFWGHAGYAITGWQNPDFRPTLAQQVVSELLIWKEPPSVRRAIRERILAAQVTAEYGRSQVLEWYLNSADYGHYAFGAEAAAQLYFGKSAAELTPAESAALAAVSQAPSLNPLDAPQVALQRGREVVHIMQALGMISPEQEQQALAENINIQAAPLTPANPAPAFLNLALNQLDQQIGRSRIERGGLVIATTLDYDLQQQAACATLVYVNRLAGAPEPEVECDAARLLPSLAPNVTVLEPSASVMILDPRSGQVLAFIGETLQGQETTFLTAHPAGSLLTPFIYLTGFTRGLGPASLVWDIPAAAQVQNPDGQYHGPVRLRAALANDYLVPAAAVTEQMGAELIGRTQASFGLDDAADNFSLFDLAGAYEVFAAQGVKFGQPLGARLQPAAVLRVEGLDHSLWLDWSAPQAQTVVTPQLAYLMNNVLSDEAVRWAELGHPNPLEIGRPVGAKLGRTNDGLDAWTVGYTPQRLVAAWIGTHTAQQPRLSARLSAGLWNALIQIATRDLPADGWSAPAGVTVMDVCDPSGLLPTKDCPAVVSEVFLNGNEPTQSDNLYRTYAVNRETGYLATVFTPPQLVEQRVYMVVPPEAEAWAKSAGLQRPPDAYDAIQPPPRNPDVYMTAPAMFADVHGPLEITGTASGADFAYYRVLVGKGLNPQEWVQVGEDVTTPVTEGVLAAWDTTGLNGLYAVQLLVVRADQRVDTTVIQVTADNTAPQVEITFPEDGQQLGYTAGRPMTFQVQASDNLALARLDFYVDGVQVGSLEQLPFALAWMSTPGEHALRVVALDRAGNQSEAAIKFTTKQ